PTASDETRSWIITPSIPITSTGSRRPSLTHKNTVSCCPSMRAQQVIREHDKAHQRRDLVTVPDMSLADYECFFCCAVISEREPDKSDSEMVLVKYGKQ